MDAQLKQEWLDALRSGEYKRGQGGFASSGRFCPLGVLCLVGDAPLTDETGSDNYPYVKGVLDGSEVDATQVWIRNDFWEWDFERMAEWLEDELQVEDDDAVVV